MPNSKFLPYTICEIFLGPKIPKLGHVTPREPFWPNFAFFSLELSAGRLCAKFEVLASTVCEILEGSQNLKIETRDPHVAPFDPILHFTR